MLIFASDVHIRFLSQFLLMGNTFLYLNNFIASMAKYMHLMQIESVEVGQDGRYYKRNYKSICISDNS